MSAEDQDSAEHIHRCAILAKEDGIEGARENSESSLHEPSDDEVTLPEEMEKSLSTPMNQDSVQCSNDEKLLKSEKVEVSSNNQRDDPEEFPVGIRSADNFPDCYSLEEPDETPKDEIDSRREERRISLYIGKEKHNPTDKSNPKPLSISSAIGFIGGSDTVNEIEGEESSPASAKKEETTPSRSSSNSSHASSINCELENSQAEHLLRREPLVKALLEMFEREKYDIKEDRIWSENLHATQRAHIQELQQPSLDVSERAGDNELGETGYASLGITEDLWQSIKDEQVSDGNKTKDLECGQEEQNDSELPQLELEMDNAETLSHLKALWGRNSKDLSADVTALLRFLTTAEGMPLFPPQEMVDILRYRQRDFCGRDRDGQSEETWIEVLLLQLCYSYLQELDQRQIVSENLAQVNPNLPNTIGQTEAETNEDEETGQTLSDLDNILSHLDSHIEALKKENWNPGTPSESDSQHGITISRPDEKVKQWAMDLASQYRATDTKEQSVSSKCLVDPRTEGQRIVGGDIYPTSCWDLLEHCPACRLRNKIVLSDMDEIEVVAVIFKFHQDEYPGAFDSNLCVLNNEKPSALRKRVSKRKNLQVKFLLEQESSVDSSAGIKEPRPERSAICCWLC